MRGYRELLGVGLAIALVGCFTEVEQRACFADGVPFADPAARPEEALRPADNIAWSAIGDVCCGGNNEAGTQTCREWFERHGGFSQDFGQLGRCAEEGYSYLDSCSGENCACMSALDCGANAVCRLVNRTEAADDVCAAQGQSGSEGRCTACFQE